MLNYASFCGMCEPFDCLNSKNNLLFVEWFISMNFLLFYAEIFKLVVSFSTTSTRLGLGVSVKFVLQELLIIRIWLQGCFGHHSKLHSWLLMFTRVSFLSAS